MNLSRYNYLFNTDNHYFLYNSLSNSFAELDNKTFNLLSNNSNIKILEQDKELFDLLKKAKVVVVDDDVELKKIEYHVKSKRFSHNTMALTINPTLDCNFACPYCFEESHTSEYMSDEVENKIIDFVRNNNEIKSLNVTWFGGEPLLGYKRIKSLTKKLQALPLSYNSGMITNGYLLTRDIIKNLKDLQINNIQITLDGLATKHDSRRCLKNGGKTFDKIMSNIDLLNELSPDTYVNIRFNVDKTNTEEFVKVYDFIQSKHYNHVSINPAFVDDINENSNNPCACNSAEKANFIKELMIKHGIGYSFMYPHNIRHECMVRNPLSIVIGPCGELYKCWNDVGKPEKVYGYIDGRITNEKVLLDYLLGGDPFDDIDCRNCKLLPVCNGGCPHARLITKNKSNSCCPLFKDNMESFLKFHYDNKNREK